MTLCPPRRSSLCRLPLIGQFIRGLCGSINSNLIREVRTQILQDRSRYNIICIGDKGTQALARPFPDLLKESINEIVAPMNFYVD